MADDYPEVSLETPLSNLGEKVLVEFGDDVAILDSRSTMDGRFRHLGLHVVGRPAQRIVDVPSQRRVGDVAATMSGLRPTRAFRLPEGGVVDTGEGAGSIILRWLLLTAVVAVVIAFLGDVDAWVRLVAVPAAIGTLVLERRLGRRWRGPQWALDTGERTVAPRELLPSSVGVPDVDAVKEEYGRLVSDIAYRIEHPALFDPHVPLTQEFTLALLRWDNTRHRLGPEEQMALGARVVSAFRAARLNAERIGMDHLPEESREQAATALSAARLAGDERATRAERSAAMGRAIRILDALALYYLPTGPEAREAIEGRGIRELPGRSPS